MERKYLIDCSSLDEVKLRYKSYVAKYLPRKGLRGNRRMFKAVEKEYESISNWPGFDQVMSKAFFEFTKFRFLIKDLYYMGLEVEMCSDFLLVTGPTHLHEKDLVEFGFQYSPVLVRWYYKPLTSVLPDPGNMNIINFRLVYGTDNAIYKRVPAAKINPQGRGDKK